MIETWYNCDKRSKKEITELLHKSERTIRREIKQGKVIVKGYLWEDLEEYSARIAQGKYEYKMTGKGPSLKLDQDINKYRRIKFYEALGAKKLDIDYVYPNDQGGYPMDLYYLGKNIPENITEDIKYIFKILHSKDI